MEKNYLFSSSDEKRKTFGLRKLIALFVVSPALIFTLGCEKNIDQDIKASSQNSITADAKTSGNIGINVVLKSPISNAILKDLSKYGNVLDQIHQINAVTMRISRDKLPTIQKLSYVKGANPDAKRLGAPIDAVPVSDFSNGLNTWNLDAINVTDSAAGRTIQQDATGVYIGILDTGLLDSWRQYFPDERIAEEYAKAFGGGGGENGNVSEQPNKWEHDQNSHGTHVTSTILGFKLGNNYFNGVAPKATVIPVKVLNQTGQGWGWSSVIARGIVYIADLKAGPLKNHPVVINMSLGGSVFDAVEKAAVDYAISKGVIIVASAGNSGEAGMGYPGAYQPVISAAMAGWVEQWTSPGWWFQRDVDDPTDPADFFIDPYSSREKAGQDLDVVAPGTNIVGPYQLNSGQLSYYYLTGTSMASPHVAGIVALMAQVNPALTPAQAETILEDVAIPMGPGSRVVPEPDGTTSTISWGADATGEGFITADAAVGALP